MFSKHKNLHQHALVGQISEFLFVVGFSACCCCNCFVVVVVCFSDFSGSEVLRTQKN